MSSGAGPFTIWKMKDRSLRLWRSSAAQASGPRGGWRHAQIALLLRAVEGLPEFLPLYGAMQDIFGWEVVSEVKEFKTPALQIQLSSRTAFSRPRT